MRNGNDCVVNLVCLNTDKGFNEMSDFVLNMVINDCAVTLEFDMLSEGVDMSTVKVLALLPGVVVPEAKHCACNKHWVIINDLLSDEDWTNIEYEIGWNYDELMRQKESRDY